MGKRPGNLIDIESHVEYHLVVQSSLVLRYCPRLVLVDTCIARIACTCLLETTLHPIPIGVPCPLL